MPPGFQKTGSGQFLGLASPLNSRMSRGTATPPIAMCEEVEMTANMSELLF